MAAVLRDGFMRTWAKTLFLTLPSRLVFPGLLCHCEILVWTFHIVQRFLVLEYAVMDYISRHLKATSPLLAHRGGVKPSRYANTVMETCSEPWEVSCKTSFSIGQTLCKDVRGLRNWFKAKPVTARTRFEWGHFLVCVSHGLPHLGSRIPPTLWPRGQRPLSHLLGASYPYPHLSVRPHVPLCR